jgi:hypothetical protein
VIVSASSSRHWAGKNQKEVHMTKVIVKNENGAEMVLYAEQHPKLWEAIQSAAGEIIGELHSVNGGERRRGRPPKREPAVSETPPVISGEADGDKVM